MSFGRIDALPLSTLACRAEAFREGGRGVPRAARGGVRFHERGPRSRSERGYTLVAIMIFITLLSIAILVVSPSISMMMKRDREQELLFRGKQYAQAILNFQKRQGRFPLNLKELMTTKPRSARQLYKEPICNCDDWGLIRVGQPWPPPKITTNPAGDSMGFGAPSGGNPGTSSPPGQTRPGAPLPTSYTTPPPGGASGNPGGDSGNPPGNANGGNGGDASGGFDLGGGNQEQSNVPIIGVYSKVHRKGLQTFHGQEFYDQWGFIAGANNDPDIPGAQPFNPQAPFIPPKPTGGTRPPGPTTRNRPPSTSNF